MRLSISYKCLHDLGDFQLSRPLQQRKICTTPSLTPMFLHADLAYTSATPRSISSVPTRVICKFCPSVCDGAEWLDRAIGLSKPLVNAPQGLQDRRVFAFWGKALRNAEVPLWVKCTRRGTAQVWLVHLCGLGRDRGW